MNPEIKAKWVAALRSGEYKQGTGKLKNEKNEFCCLGVLCDTRFKEFKDSFNSNTDNSFPSDVVINWAGLEKSDPNIFTKSIGWTTVSILNDQYFYSFDQIADLIEAQL